MNDSFFRRWSERKQSERKQEEQHREKPVESVAESPDRAVPAEPPTGLPPEEIEARIAELPSLSDIGAGTDIRPFLQDFVPAELRNAAMRRAWLTDPVISTYLDVARDYAWDFNAGDGPDGFYRTVSEEVSARAMSALNPSVLPNETSATDPPGPAATPVAEFAPAEKLPETADAAPECTLPDTPELQVDTVPSKPEARLRLPKGHGGALPD